MTSLPSRKDEAWRYADLKRLASLWPERNVQHRALSGACLQLDEHITGPGWHDAEIDIEVADGGQLAGKIAQAADADATVTQLYRIRLGKGAQVALTLTSHGAAYGRILLDVQLAEGAEFHLGGALVAGSGQTLELVTFMRHIGPGASSRQDVRAVAGGLGVTSYLGQVAVARDAQKTDAAQSFKALLLDRGATANAKPELEIYADDVKCAHGASVGELDRAALFYLQSRGITPATAEALLATAFVDDALVRLPEDDASRAALASRLAGLVAARGSH
jgi:Fe-S cluster assembly protein SufD